MLTRGSGRVGGLIELPALGTIHEIAAERAHDRGVAYYPGNPMAWLTDATPAESTPG